MIKLPFLIRLRAHLEDKKLLRSLDPETTQFRWKTGPRCPQKCVEANRTCLGSHLFLTGGYVGELATVSRKLFMLDMETDRWSDLGEIPTGMPETHNGFISDNQRYLFSITGQLGAHCSPPVSDCFSYDTHLGKWGRLPALPEPRYAPLVHYYNERIYCMGGSKPDRSSPALDRWSLGIRDGHATEPEWCKESPMLAGFTHTASLILNDKLYIFGGQTGDVPRIPGDLEHTCDFTYSSEVFHSSVYSIDLVTQESSKLASMPHPASHTEYNVIKIGHRIIIVSGNQSRAILNNTVLSYHLLENKWEIIGLLPYHLKGPSSAFYKGWLYVIAGQRSASDDDLRPGLVLDSVWKARLDFLFESS